MVQGLRLLLSNPDLAKDASAVLQGGAPSERLVAALRGMQSLATTATDSSSVHGPPISLRHRLVRGAFSLAHRFT